MSRIIMSGPQNMTLDGVVHDPDGAEGSRHGDWFRQFGGADLAAWNEVATEEALAASAWLLGRRSYEFFGARWQARTGVLADRLNTMPKYVVSSSLTDPDWSGTTVLIGDPVARVTELKASIDGDIVMPASYRLARTLIAHDLVDELRVVVFPVAIGEGERLFDGLGPTPLRLIDSTTIGLGLAFLRFEVVHRAHH